MTDLKIGMIGLDTSHAPAFTELLHDPGHRYHIRGGRVTYGYSGGSPDFPLSISRVEGYTAQLQSSFGVKIVDTPEEVAENCDAILLEAADGRVHLDLFKRIAPYRKPVFIDKPLSLTMEDAEEIERIAASYGIPVFSSSALRYAESLQLGLQQGEGGRVFGADVYGPMDVQSTQRHYFWYGIHSVEMLVTIMGRGCEEVFAFSSEEHELITCRWNDGRIGTVRGNRCGNYGFGATIHRESGDHLIDIGSSKKPFYASLLEQVMNMFTTGIAPLEFSETMEVIRILDAAEQSRQQRAPVHMSK
ncbi:Gfo/Idh/MocA family protein [Marinicrinis lubricantis]|uniref:Gfo/Idh/MocA family protein n=1 Tax=Marinicrinis lubricantis TaxID=2086470 RepID=A0ABW1IRG6_9BACL